MADSNRVTCQGQYHVGESQELHLGPFITFRPSTALIS